MESEIPKDETSSLRGSLVRSKTLGTGALRGSLVEPEAGTPPELFVHRDTGELFEVTDHITRDDGAERIKLRLVGGDRTVTKDSEALQADLAQEAGVWSRYIPGE